MILSAPYDDIIKILEDIADEKGVQALCKPNLKPSGLVKEIYDLERGQTHLNARSNEVELRKILLKYFADWTEPTANTDI